ncbi:MAG TPA: hypothetical protein VF234_00485 [Limnochordia bacterium]
MRPYAGIPDPGRAGLFVDENAALLRRYRYIEERSFRILSGHFPGTGEWEAKHVIARHAWEDAQHTRALRERIATLRVARRQVDEPPDERLVALMDEAARAADTVELFAGIHLVIKAALIESYRWHLETTNHVADFPTVRELKIILQEEEEQMDWVHDAWPELCDTPQKRERAEAWMAHLQTFLAAAGGIRGDQPTDGVQAAPPRDTAPFYISRHPQRDRRFQINFQFNEPGDPPAQTIPEKLIFMMRGRLNELAATECVASTIYEVDGQPFEFYLELARHMWDEARHSMLGQAVIESLGHDVKEWPLRIGPGYSYLSVTPWERYAHLGLNIEQGMMKYPPGKREEYEWCRDVAKNPLAAMYQDYDWADEVYHTQVARRWIGSLFDNDPHKMREFARSAAQKIAANTKQIAEIWHAKRAEGGMLGEGDPLPVSPERPANGATPIPSEFAVPPELTLTKEEIEEDLKRGE